jgi:hypothetical protein
MDFPSRWDTVSTHINQCAAERPPERFARGGFLFSSNSAVSFAHGTQKRELCLQPKHLIVDGSGNLRSEEGMGVPTGVGRVSKDGCHP